MNQPQLIVEPGFLSDPGIVRRADPNEDAFGTPESMKVAPGLVAQKGALYVVCDGMGGHNAGDVASNTAVRRIFAEFYADPNPDARQRLERAMQAANTEIRTLAAAEPSRSGMGTTCVAAVLIGYDLLVANVGDSRAYLVRGGQTTQITHDHSWVEEQRQAGFLSQEQAKNHSLRNVITRALGHKPQVQVDYFTQKLQPGDVVLLCSDGFSNQVTDTEMATAFSRARPQAAITRLVALANQRGGPDNITAVAVKLGRGGRRAVGTSPLVAILITLAVVVVGLYGAIFLGGGIQLIPGPAMATPAPISMEATPTPVTPVPPTATLVPTPGPKTPTWTATVPAIPQPAATNTPVAAQPGVIYNPPVLKGPADGMTFTGKETKIVLTWEPVTPTLGMDDYYAVKINHRATDGSGGTWHRWLRTKNTEIKVPENLFDLGFDNRKYPWTVRVFRFTGFPTPTTESDKEEGTPVSDESETRTFIWKTPGDQPVPTPTPER